MRRPRRHARCKVGIWRSGRAIAASSLKARPADARGLGPGTRSAGRPGRWRRSRLSRRLAPASIRWPPCRSSSGQGGRCCDIAAASLKARSSWTDSGARADHVARTVAGRRGRRASARASIEGGAAMAAGRGDPRARSGPRASRPVTRAASRPLSREGSPPSPRAGVPRLSAPSASLRAPDNPRGLSAAGRFGPRARAPVGGGPRRGGRFSHAPRRVARSASRRVPSRHRQAFRAASSSRRALDVTALRQPGPGVFGLGWARPRNGLRAWRGRQAACHAGKVGGTPLAGPTPRLEYHGSTFKRERRRPWRTRQRSVVAIRRASFS